MARIVRLAKHTYSDVDTMVAIFGIGPDETDEEAIQAAIDMADTHGWDDWSIGLRSVFGVDSEQYPGATFERKR